MQFIYEEISDIHDVFRLVGNNSIKSSGTRSKYKYDNDKTMCGLRVTLTYTFTGIRTIAPILISMLGLNKRELPQNHCISIDIPGLCVGTGGVTVGNNQRGILFMIGESGIDKNRYRIYRDEVQLPFLSKSREEFGK